MTVQFRRPTAAQWFNSAADDLLSIQHKNIITLSAPMMCYALIA
jgi:hypothetical protein